MMSHIESPTGTALLPEKITHPVNQGSVVHDLQTAKTIERRVRRLGRRRLFSFGTLGWCVTDMMIAVVSMAVGYLLSPVAGLTVNPEAAVRFFPCALAYAILLAPVAHVAGLHDPLRRGRFSDLAVRCLLTTFFAMCALLLFWMLLSYLRIGRYVLLISATTTITAMIMSRLISWNWSSTFRETVCFLGSREHRERVEQMVSGHRLPIQFSGTPRKDQNLVAWAIENNVDEIVYEHDSLTDGTGLLGCLDAGIKVSSYTDFVEEKYHQVPVDNIEANWLFSARLDLAHPYYQGIKRLVDLMVSVTGLIASAPLIAIAAILIRVESRGPVLYSQVRVGRFNRPFRIYKLRTMVNDSEKDGAQWAAVNDARITMVGTILRKTRLDELPQFWNVLKGDMSLIGPRPERPEFVEQLSDEIRFYMQRHLVKPGLTGWAQINYPYGASIEDAYNKLTYDLYYIKNASVGLDLQILLRTIGTVMKGSR